MRNAALVAALVAAVAPRASADPAPVEPASPRSIGRAGVGLVSDDGGLAALSNPAAMARRGQARLAVGVKMGETDTEIDRGGAVTGDQAGPRVVPSLGFARGLGERWVVGVAVLQSQRYRRRYPAPRFGEDPGEIARLYPFRYAGLKAKATSWTAAGGAAVRLSDWLAVGASLRVTRLEASERRAVWAGLAERDPVGSAERDLVLDLGGDAAARPGAALGLLAAPAGVPIELAAAVGFDAPSHLEGRASLSPTRAAGSGPEIGPDVAASLALPGRLVAATGVRYLAPRLALEVNAEAVLLQGDDAGRWRTGALETTDEGGTQGTLKDPPALLGSGDHVAVRGALDVSLIDGFLWFTAGYAFRSRARPREGQNPLLAAPPTHRVAAGIEALWSGFTLTVGYARDIAKTTHISPGETGVLIVNPFGDGTAPAADGRYRESSDRGALRIEYAWP